MESVTISGTKADLFAARSLLKDHDDLSLKIGEIGEQHEDPPTGKMGMEPMTYFFVVTAGHLSAAAIIAIVKKVFGKDSGVNVKEDEK